MQAVTGRLSSGSVLFGGGESTAEAATLGSAQNDEWHPPGLEQSNYGAPFRSLDHGDDLVDAASEVGEVGFVAGA